MDIHLEKDSGHRIIIGYKDHQHFSRFHKLTCIKSISSSIALYDKRFVQ